MQIQSENGVIDIAVAWLAPDELELSIAETINGETHYHRTRYFAPEELTRLADYINDTLCR
jgi:hypothetical protein